MLICNPAIIPEFLGSRGRHCRRNSTRNSWQEVSRPDIKMASSCKEISQSPFQFLIELSNASYRKHPIGYPSQQEKTNHSKQFEFFNQKNIKSNPKLILTCRKHISRAWYGLGLFFHFFLFLLTFLRTWHGLHVFPRFAHTSLPTLHLETTYLLILACLHR